MITQKERDAVANALGREVDDVSINNAHYRYGKWTLSGLKSQLVDKESVFQSGGGRGVELADEIDELKIAIASREIRDSSH